MIKQTTANLGLITVFIFALNACQSSGPPSPANDTTAKQKEEKLPDRLSARRVSFALDLKEKVAAQAWPDFAKLRNEGTLVYFDSNSAEVFFADSLILSKLDDYSKYSVDYLQARINSPLPYHMEVMISFDESDSAEYFYKNAVEQYSSVEEIGQFIPSVESTEMWATMVVHEMFHHFQYNILAFRTYAENEIGILPFNVGHMIGLCREDGDFLKLIQQENKLLMEALATENLGEVDALIQTFLSAREARMERYGAELPHLEKVEDYYVIQEGSARYIEYETMFILSDYAKAADAPLVANDSKFKAYQEFEEIDLNDPVFNYLVYPGATDYHYTLGFTMMRLLDKLQVAYKESLLNNPQKGLHRYLEEYLAKLP